jgi:hypothetical protein
MRHGTLHSQITERGVFYAAWSNEYPIYSGWNWAISSSQFSLIFENTKSSLKSLYFTFSSHQIYSMFFTVIFPATSK